MRIAFLMAALYAAPGLASVSVTDSLGNEITLQQPPARIVSLAPHITELVFAAGAGDLLVGVSEYSDYPAAAQNLPRVGDGFRVDLEQVAALEPDVVIAWASGNPRTAVAQLRRLGIPVMVLETRELKDIATQIELIGQLAGREEQADETATDFREQLAVLRARYAGRTPVRVFYQVDDRPLFTVNGRHSISEVIELCGGENIFAELDTLAPNVSHEAVLQRDPQAIIGSGAEHDEDAIASMMRWLAWKDLAAARYTNLFLVEGDFISRATPRILIGAREICKDLDEARANMEKFSREERD